MAIFERRYHQCNENIDDTILISCIIETAQEVNGHTEYLLRLQRGPSKENCWRLLKRYNDFVTLHKNFIKSGIPLSLPGKRLFGNMRPDFIAERRQALQQYINDILMNPILASSLPAKRFVDPDTYSQSFHDQAVQNALLCLRHENLWNLGTSLGAIGWRLRKHYFKVTPKPPDSKASNKLVKSSSQTHSQSKHFLASNASNNGSGSGSGTMFSTSIDLNKLEGCELVLEWSEYGPDKYIEEKELTGIFKSVTSLQHPHIESVVYAAHNESGCLTIRKFHKQGSLKDILCMATPKNTFLSKYGNPKGRTALSMKQVANYGKQILEALIFLHSKGFPYGHLHSGNVVIIDDCVKLLDIENYILGVPAFYRPFFVQHSKIHTPEAIDVYCFGHVLFEMAQGYPLQESVVRQISECPESLKNLLESILSRDACRTNLPTLEQLLNHTFFEQHAAGHSQLTNVDDTLKPHFKLTLNAKEMIKQAVQKAENRLRDEQKSVKNQKRIVRVQELMSSEEEKRKTKQKAKLEHKQSKLKQQASLQANNGRISLIATASGSVPEYADVASGATASSSSAIIFQRCDTTGATLTSPDNREPIFKSPPPTPSAYQRSKQASNHNQFAQQHSPGQSTSLANVERQSSTPNITTSDDHHGGNDNDVNEDNGLEKNRSALLESICKFNRGSLRKVRSND
ncbi:PX domain-containing protein kinase-like protein [Glossina fuscipes fuscipes]